MRYLTACLLAAIYILLGIDPVVAASDDNHYGTHILAANKEEYAAAITEPKLLSPYSLLFYSDADGVRYILPGTGGMLSLEDVTTTTPVKKNGRKLSLWLPVAADSTMRFFPSAVLVESPKDFLVDEVQGGKTIQSPARIIMLSRDGKLMALTRPDATAVIKQVADLSGGGVYYTGLAVNQNQTRLYAANFGAAPGIDVFNGGFKKLRFMFQNPFDGNRNGKTDPGEYAPYNISLLKTPSGQMHFFIAYAKTTGCSGKNSCDAGDLLAGVPDITESGYGRIAEFNVKGELIAVWKDAGRLTAPWGMAFAPEGFGVLSGALLVASSADGRIAAYDPASHVFRDYLRDKDGNPLVIHHLHGLFAQDGLSGDTVYFSAGSQKGQHGMIGSIRKEKIN